MWHAELLPEQKVLNQSLMKIHYG